MHVCARESEMLSLALFEMFAVAIGNKRTHAKAPNVCAPAHTQRAEYVCTRIQPTCAYMRKHTTKTAIYELHVLDIRAHAFQIPRLSLRKWMKKGHQKIQKQSLADFQEICTCISILKCPRMIIMAGWFEIQKIEKNHPYSKFK